MTRIHATFLLLALACAAAPASAQDAVRLSAKVAVSGDTVSVGGTRVTGPETATLRLFAGREVEVEVVRSSGHVRRIQSPVQVELRGTCDRTGLTTEDRGLVKLFGPAAHLVPRDRVALVDAWLFPAAGGAAPEACVVAVEGRTTGDWNLVHAYSAWKSPIDVIRSRRAVWLLGRRDGRYLVQRGGTKGWVSEDLITAGEPIRAGLAGSLR